MQSARLETTAERALLRRIEGGCQVPLGAIGRLTGNKLQSVSAVCALDGAIHVSAEGNAEATLSAAAALGVRLAESLLEQGAARIIEGVRGGPRAPAWRRLDIISAAAPYIADPSCRFRRLSSSRAPKRAMAR